MKNLILAGATIVGIGANSAAMAQSFAHIAPPPSVQTNKTQQSQNAQPQPGWSATQAAPAGPVVKQDAGPVRTAPAS